MFYFPKNVFLTYVINKLKNFRTVLDLQNYCKDISESSHVHTLSFYYY